MTRLIVELDDVGSTNAVVGGKAGSLGKLIMREIKVPSGSVITGEAYERYVDETGLKGRIILELNRKRFDEMRWEEIWDTSQRIRHMFNTTALPNKLKEELELGLSHLSQMNTVVRSSSIQEDGSNTSFAGLHESYVNVKGISNVLEKTRLVWASLWSDAALLYRQELGLSVEDSSMPVIVQKMIYGNSSGVVFSRSPDGRDKIMVEAVYGLCKGLVDGTIEPDRWTITRSSLDIVSHFEPERLKAIRAGQEGTFVEKLNEQDRKVPPINPDQLKEIAKASLIVEDLFGLPQDIEWTISDDMLFIIQARPITSSISDDDVRSWYISLRRSIDNLVELEKRISHEIIPEMNREAASIKRVNLTQLSDIDLIEEINHRAERLRHWHKIYWNDFIPMAHGARLFGQVYNDRVKPDDPHEFTTLLSGTDMLSTTRNTRLLMIAEVLMDNPRLKKEILSETIETDELRREITDLIGKSSQNMKQAVELLEKLIARGKSRKIKNSDSFKKAYLLSFPEQERPLAEELLRIGRRSWKLRDDDNIILGQFENLLSKTLEEAKKRLLNIGVSQVEDLMEGEVVLSLSMGRRVKSEKKRVGVRETSIKPRQLVGQPAGPGLVTGKARVVKTDRDLFDFNTGEVLVCDAIDPNMTFVVPLASGIIERRGGMLIHGAIIAREYGIPCVTGIPEASEVIKTGDLVTVDGYLGIVTIKRGN